MERTWRQTAQFLSVWLLILSARGEEAAAASGQLESSGAGVVNNSVTVVPLGEAAKLACPVPAEMYGTRVSWIRNKDIMLLALADQVIAKDPRIFVTHSGHPDSKESPRHSQVWFLHIKDVTPDDEGDYQCQTSTHPHVSFLTFLKIQKAYSIVQGPKERVVAAGSDLQLVCIFKNFTAPPAYVFWYQDEKMVNYDSSRGIFVSSGGRDHSILKVQTASEEHQGNYTCAPANIAPSSVLVHVIPETTESSGGDKDQKREEKTPVRQLGVKSASSAGSRDLPRLLQLFLFGVLFCLMEASSSTSSLYSSPPRGLRGLRSYATRQ
ncbi:neurotrimin-like isoform X1 [Macrobrachium rosenbergii]|uniref:neurotrimin-like isoform X1 n=1 Tax=Macrobrachium rosenbergii TaxID=79674 RepID=UPI0034D66796